MHKAKMNTLSNELSCLELEPVWCKETTQGIMLLAACLVTTTVVRGTMECTPGLIAVKLQDKEYVVPKLKKLKVSPNLNPY